MYIFYDTATQNIEYTAIGSNDLVTGKTNWIEVPEQELGDLSAWKIINGALVMSNIEPLRVEAVNMFNTRIGEVREMFITPLPGQEMIYLRKEQEARDYLNDANPVLANYPLIAREIGITGVDANQVAQIWLNMAVLWMTVAGILEQIRLGHSAMLSSCNTIAEIDTVKVSFNSAITTFLASV